MDAKQNKDLQIRLLQYAANGATNFAESCHRDEWTRLFASDDVDGQASWLMEWLTGQGYVMRWGELKASHGFDGLSPTGYDYLDRLKHPVRAGFKRLPIWAIIVSASGVAVGAIGIVIRFL